MGKTINILDLKVYKNIQICLIWECMKMRASLTYLNKSDLYKQKEFYYVVALFN